MQAKGNEWRDAGRESKLEIVKAAYARPPILWVTTEVLIHELHEGAVEALERAKIDRSIIESPLGPACPCCGSRLARITEVRPDLSLYIDRTSGKRVRPERLTPEQRAKVEAAAEHVHIPLRVSREQLHLLYRDAGKKDLVSGSMRSGKSQVCAYALTREWLLHGGKGAHFWVAAPKRIMAFELMRKIIYGDDTAPPILPAVLFNYIPTTEHKTRARLVDGSVLSLKHLGSKRGTNLKSDSVRCIVVDEACELSDRDQLNNLEGRVHTTKGRLLLCSTPTKNHWLRELVRDPCVAWEVMKPEEREQHPTHAAHYWRYTSLGMTENPWIDPVHTLREMESKGGMDDPAVMREYRGLWTGAAGALWRMFSLTENIIDNHYRDLDEWDEMRSRNITRNVARKLFGGFNPNYPGLRASNLTFIGGMDVNCSPHTTLLLQAACDPDDPQNRDKWSVYVWDGFQTHEDAAVHAAMLHGKQFAKMVRRGSDGETYRGMGIICDGASVNHDPTAHRHGGDPKGLAKIFGSKGFDLRPPEHTNKGKAANPHLADSYRLVQTLLRERRLFIHARVGFLRDALLEQEDSGDHVTPIKVSGNRSDRVSSSVDAMRYALWAIFHGGESSAVLMDGGGMTR